MISRGAELSGEIAEIACAADSLHTYRTSALAAIQRVVRFDVGSLQNSHTHLSSNDPVAVMLDENLGAYVAEYNPQEVARMCEGFTRSANEVFSKARMERLRVFTEYVHEVRCKTIATRVWCTTRAVLGTFWGRDGSAFTESELALLDAVVPVMTVAEGLLMRSADDSTLDGRLQRLALTRAERQIAELVARGLTNREIAQLLRCSVHTVRNHLARAFKRTCVSTRAEFVFLVLSQASEGPRPRVPGRFIEHARAMTPGMQAAGNNS